eukprot:CAMPEP_0194494192 /NCGR_PEP_ID=MMETSP0253-20130528/12175_1 /TAXON_ID=2966 /ORGANISM="Noctiluca scintillans" /LENGTH=55 /DNA_ID=CAMNT_0039335269 /DNA_START=903 /DNA_END=1066 /DNA_ORIENTATION=-
MGTLLTGHPTRVDLFAEQSRTPLKHAERVTKHSAQRNVLAMLHMRHGLRRGSAGG